MREGVFGTIAEIDDYSGASSSWNVDGLPYRVECDDGVVMQSREEQFVVVRSKRHSHRERSGKGKALDKKSRW